MEEKLSLVNNDENHQQNLVKPILLHSATGLLSTTGFNDIDLAYIILRKKNVRLSISLHILANVILQSMLLMQVLSM